MRLFIVTLCAAAALATAAGAQPAASANQDAKCLLEMVALSNASDPQAQRAGQDGVVFFAGRISAHEPNFDFRRLKTMAQGLSPQTAQTELQQTCGPLIQRYMQQLDAALSPPASAPATPPATRPAPPAAH